MKESRIGLITLLLFSALFAQVAGATPVPLGWTTHANSSATFNFTSGSATVTSDVYGGYTGTYAGKYIYVYRIFNDNAAPRLNFFSVDFVDATSAYSPDFESVSGSVDPLDWDVVGTPVQSVGAFFKITIDPGKSSAKLWFVSDHGSGLGSGSLFGKGGAFDNATGLLMPVPEPTTLGLIGLGALLCRRFKRKERI